MARHRTTPRRRRVFVGTEGESERSFAAWLQQLCDTNRRPPLHLDISLGSGGDGVRVVEDAATRYRRRSSQRGLFSAGLVLLDADRLDEDRQRGRDPEMAARGTGLRLVLLRPNLEGVLARLFPGNERRQLSIQDTEGVLRVQWPEYRKPATALELGRRFRLDDLRRAAAYDDALGTLLAVLGLS